MEFFFQQIHNCITAINVATMSGGIATVRFFHFYNNNKKI